MSRYYSWNGRLVTEREYAALISDLIARGHCIHAENCEHTRPIPPGGDR